MSQEHPSVTPQEAKAAGQLALQSVTEAHDRAGNTNDFIASRLHDLSKAKWTQAFLDRKRGKVIYAKDRDDHQTQLAAIQEISRQKGLYPAEQGGPSQVQAVQFILSGVDPSQLPAGSRIEIKGRESLLRDGSGGLRMEIQAEDEPNNAYSQPRDLLPIGVGPNPSNPDSMIPDSSDQSLHNGLLSDPDVQPRKRGWPKGKPRPGQRRSPGRPRETRPESEGEADQKVPVPRDGRPVEKFLEKILKSEG